MYRQNIHKHRIKINKPFSFKYKAHATVFIWRARGQLFDAGFHFAPLHGFQGLKSGGQANMVGIFAC